MAADRAPSLKDVYIAECARVGCRTNSQLLRTLPNAPGDYTSLKELNLNLNCVGKNGVKALYHIISLCQNLERLLLADNFLTNESVKELVAALQEHPGVETVDLSHNPISHFAGKLLSELVGKNEAITDLLIQDTLINPALVKIIERKAASNRVKRATKEVVVASPPHHAPPAADVPSPPARVAAAEPEPAPAPAPTPAETKAKADVEVRAQAQATPEQKPHATVVITTPPSAAATPATDPNASLPYLAEIFALCNEPQEGTAYDFTSVQTLAEVTRESFPEMLGVYPTPIREADDAASALSSPAPSPKRTVSVKIDPTPREDPVQPAAAPADAAAKPRGSSVTILGEEDAPAAATAPAPPQPSSPASDGGLSATTTSSKKVSLAASPVRATQQPSADTDNDSLTRSMISLGSSWNGLTMLHQLARRDVGDGVDLGLTSMCEAAALRSPQRQGATPEPTQQQPTAAAAVDATRDALPPAPHPARRQSSNLRVLLQAGAEEDLSSVRDLVDYCEVIESGGDGGGVDADAAARVAAKQEDAITGAVADGHGMNPAAAPPPSFEWYAMDLIWGIAAHKIEAQQAAVAGAAAAGAGTEADDWSALASVMQLIRHDEPQGSGGGSGGGGGGGP